MIKNPNNPANLIPSKLITYTICTYPLFLWQYKGDVMSNLVCHMEKYHKQDVAPIEKENERDEKYEASNPQIDSERTRNN